MGDITEYGGNQESTSDKKTMLSLALTPSVFCYTPVRFPALRPRAFARGCFSLKYYLLYFACPHNWDDIMYTKIVNIIL